MYEELTNRLKRYSEACVAYKLDADFAYAVQEAIEVISKTGKTTRWIPVSERLPKYGDWVLGIGPKKGYHVCEYRGISHFVYGGDTPWFSAKGRSISVTHWMPLPEPPKEET